MSEPNEQLEPENKEVDETLAEIGVKSEGNTLPTGIDQGDFNLLIPAMRELEASANALKQVQQQIALAQQRFLGAQGAVDYIFKHLKPKYQIRDGEDIDIDGLIIRKE
jgi:hypothetical protein